MLKEFKNETEINNFFDDLKNITIKAFSEKRKVEYQRYSSAPSTDQKMKAQPSINTYQINIWDNVTSYENVENT